MPLYTDFRYLNKMDIVRRGNGEWDVSRAHDTSDQMKFMRDFAVNEFCRPALLQGM